MAAAFVYATLWLTLFGRARPGSTIGPVAHLILHHELGRPLPATATIAQERARLKAIDAYHRSLGWQGFGYSVMPCASGRVHEGRGYRRSGAHTGHMNRTAYAALLPGTDTGMTPAQVDGLRAWQADGIDQGHILPDAIWSAHRDHMPRDCPGDRNYAQLHLLNAPDEDTGMTPAQARQLDDLARAVARIERRIGTRNNDRATVFDDTARLRRSVRAIGAKLGIPVADSLDEVDQVDA